MINSLQKSNVGTSLNGATVAGAGVAFALPPRQTDQSPQNVTAQIRGTGALVGVGLNVNLEGALDGDPTFVYQIVLGTINALDANGNGVLNNVAAEVAFVRWNLTQITNGSIVGIIRNNA
jgi:hypothetical protein